LAAVNASHTDWSDLAVAYAESFAPMCAGTTDPLLDTLLPSYGGRRVLDVGSGLGTLGAAARDRGATVTLAEPDAGMRAVAAAEHPHLPQHDTGLPHLGFEDDAFDAVVANFVVNHVADPRAGVRELLRVTAPGGRLGVTIWPNGPDSPGALWPRVLEAAGVEPPAPRHLPPDKDFARTVDGLASLLLEAHDVEVWEHSWGWRVDPDALWSGPARGVSAFGQVLLTQEPAVRDELRRAYDTVTAPLRDGGLLVLPVRAVLAVATA